MKKNFTLLELLLVMFIMGALLAVAVPVFNNLVRGRETERAAAELSARIAYARSYAADKHVYVAIVFPRATGSGKLENIAGGNIPGGYFNSSYRAAIVNRVGNTYKFSSWLPESQWNFFPDGIIIPPGSDNFGVQKSNDRSEDDYLKVSSIDMPVVQDVDLDEVSSGKKSDMERCLVFRPDGQLVSGDKKHVLIRFAEAVYDPAAIGLSSFRFTARNPDESGNISYTVLDLNPLTGKTRYAHVEDSFQGQE